MKSVDVDIVIDVGANIGQFAVDLRRMGFAGKIFSFEPDLENFLFLEMLTRKDSNWKAFNIALGSMEGSAILNVSKNNGLSSSFLKMDQRHTKSFPESNYVSEKKVKISTLDNFVDLHQIDLSHTLLKMDVQGFEYEVLKGGINSIKMLQGIYFESSLVTLYEGEMLFQDLIQELREYDFIPYQIYPGSTDKDGRMLQVDTLVVREAR